MTTIAYKDGVMACDSKCTDEYHAFVTRTQKIFRLANGALLGTAGDSDTREVNELLGKATPKKLPAKKDLAATKTYFCGILAFPNGKVFMVDICGVDVGSMDSEWTACVLEIEEHMCAIGTGHQYALGAMSSGKSAAQAVQIACRFDSLSQAPVREVVVKQDKRNGKARSS